MHASRGARIAFLVLLASLVRLVHLQAVLPTPLPSYHRTFLESDMYMFDRWAHKILEGDVLGRERYHFLYRWQLRIAPEEKWTQWYGERPVFYKAPFYPYLLALLYRLFGDAVLPLALLQIAASAASVALLFGITQRLFGETAATFAGLALALYAPDVHFDVIMLRGPWIVLTSLLATRQLLGLRSRPSFGSSTLLGLAMGAALLVNEGFAPALPLAALLVLAWFGWSRRSAVGLGGLALGFAVAFAPVALRNALVGSPLLKLAVTGSTVYSVFNTAGTTPFFFEIRPSRFVPILESSGGDLLRTVVACLRSFSGPTEVLLFYLGKAAGLVIPFENPDNVSIYYVTLKSPLLGVLPGYGLLFPLASIGLVLARRRLRDLAPLAPAALSVLLAIVLTLTLSRYRATLAVLMMPLAGLALAQALEWARQRRLVPLGLAIAASVSLGAVASLLQARVVFGGRPAERYLYRPAEFLLGTQFYAGHGRRAEAVREALDLARLNPDLSVKAWALLTVGQLEARGGETAAAREALAGATQLGGGSPELLMAVGDAYAADLGDPAAALGAYRTAAALPAPEPLRAQLQERLRRLEAAPGVK